MLSDPNRGTGRTTTQLRECLDYVSRGANVVFVVHNRQFVDQALRMAFELASQLVGPPDRVQANGINRRLVLGDCSLEIRPADKVGDSVVGRDVVVVVDHHAMTAVRPSDWVTVSLTNSQFWARRKHKAQEFRI